VAVDGHVRNGQKLFAMATRTLFSYAKSAWPVATAKMSTIGLSSISCVLAVEALPFQIVASGGEFQTLSVNFFIHEFDSSSQSFQLTVPFY
jgi:hypothetical protein